MGTTTNLVWTLDIMIIMQKIIGCLQYKDKTHPIRDHTEIIKAWHNYEFKVEISMYF
jgi:hypothetical protein